MSKQLNFLGDVTGSLPEILPGPGNVTYRVTGSEYDARANTTAVHAEPIDAAELAQFIDDRREDTFARIDDRLRVAEIFGGAP